MNILTIDDSKSVHAFLNECFKDSLCTLDHAYNGQEGVQKYLANPTKYDLILLDWEMPVLTGPETFAELSKHHIQIPVIMLTSKNTVDDITQMLTAGVAEYVMKPFTQDLLLEKVESITGKPVRNHVAAA
jgi:DNA-binding response OmpR family regulator